MLCCPLSPSYQSLSQGQPPRFSYIQLFFYSWVVVLLPPPQIAAYFLAEKLLPPFFWLGEGGATVQEQFMMCDEESVGMVTPHRVGSSQSIAFWCNITTKREYNQHFTDFENHEQ